MGARALVVGRTGYGDEALRGAIEGAFINAAMAREIVELRKKAQLWDMHWEIESRKRQERFDEINKQKEIRAQKSRNIFRRIWGMLVVKESD